MSNVKPSDVMESTRQLIKEGYLDEDVHSFDNSAWRGMLLDKYPLHPVTTTLQTQIKSYPQGDVDLMGVRRISTPYGEILFKPYNKEGDPMGIEQGLDIKYTHAWLSWFQGELTLHQDFRDVPAVQAKQPKEGDVNLVYVCMNPNREIRRVTIGWQDHGLRSFTIAICHPKDQFSRRMGRITCKGKLEEPVKARATLIQADEPVMCMKFTSNVNAYFPRIVGQYKGDTITGVELARAVDTYITEIESRNGH